MQNQITYYRKNNHIECIFYKNSRKAYPVHTHANHFVLGFVMEGEVRLICGGQEQIYPAGGYFCVQPDTMHAIEPVGNRAYSMISICVFISQTSVQLEKQAYHIKELKQIILTAPENTFLIEEMAKSIGFSPYHMIRQFQSVCGLTPHQFQIQCRVRKGQRLLEEGKSVTEAAYGAGFCDQSHFDRCFRKVVSLTPSEYRKSVRLLT